MGTKKREDGRFVFQDDEDCPIRDVVARFVH